MPKPPFVEFAPDDALQDALHECTESFDVGDPSAEWPHNILSNRLVVYQSGRIAREGEPIEHRVDPDELDLIRRLAHDCAKVMEGVNVGMGSEVPSPFHEFHSAINIGEAVPETIAARHMGIRVLGISCITNMAAGVLKQPLDHLEVLEVGEKVKVGLIDVLSRIIVEAAKSA